MFPNVPSIFNANGPSGGGGSGQPAVIVNGTTAAPILLAGATALAVTAPGTTATEFNFIRSTGGAVVMSANPQIAASTAVGKVIVMTGTSDTDTVEFNNGNGLIFNGPWVARNGSLISFFWDGTNYRENSRNDI